MSSRHKNRKAVEQITPTFQVLEERYNSGLTSKKEITRRVEVGLSNKTPGETKKAFESLKRITLKEGWINE